MRRTRIPAVGLVILAGLAGSTGLTGCSDEIPTTVGAGIVDPGYRSYEVVLDADAFLQADTTYDRIGSTHSAPFALVANAFEGELDAHTLFRVNVPTSAVWQDTAGNTMSDSAFTIVGANVTLVLDTLSEAAGPIDLEAVQLTESWDPGSVTWELRADTADAPLPWAEPGGTPGAVLSAVRWISADTVVMPLDSAAAAVLTDSAAAFHGGIVRATSPGARLRIQSIGFAFEVRPESQDTVVEAGSARAGSFIVTPGASTPAAGELRVGGVPTWRSAIQFRRMADVEIPCGDGTGCTLPLSDATVNLASLVLHPLAVGSRRIERPYRVEARAILRAPGVPLSRSALAASYGTMAEAIEPAAFTGASPDATAEIPLTSYIRQNIDPPTEGDPVLWVALLARDERAAPVFGYGAYGGLASAEPPRLRLVVTAPIEEVR